MRFAKRVNRLFRRYLLATIGLFVFFCQCATALPQSNDTIHAPPGLYRTSWIGNSFGGNGGPNGEGYWVQQGADEIEVTADGTVFAGVAWDEAGRCAGLYKDGQVNRRLLKEHNGKGKETAWGFGTANEAISADGETLYVANTGKQLQRYTWRPGQLESPEFLDEIELADTPIGLNVRSGRIAVVFAGRVEVLSAATLEVTQRIEINDVHDVALMDDGRMWILAAGSVAEFSTAGRPTGRRLDGLQKPMSVALGHDGRLVVAEDGPDQQVRFFAGSGEPKPLGEFGEKGGVTAARGVVAPKRLFALRGAGTDSAGNLYVAMGFSGGPQGNLFLRSFDRLGNLRWELHSAAFVDCYGFDADKDGEVIYGRTTVWDMDYRKSTPGTEARLRGISLDPVTTPVDDFRRKDSGTTLFRRIAGRETLLTMHMMAGGFQFYPFDTDSLIAQPGGAFTASDAWAWDVESDGTLWWGDAPGKQIRRIPFLRWNSDGAAEYATDKQQVWPWPVEMSRVTRIIYDDDTDTLYLWGYPNGISEEAWGVIGFEARRYDGWCKGSRVLRWKAKMPLNEKGNDKGGPLTGKSVALAGDYLFIGMVKPDGPAQHYVHIYSTADGSYVGSLRPQAEFVGEAVGWIDMVIGVQSHRRHDGEYLILVEDDWRGKNLLYRWRP